MRRYVVLALVVLAAGCSALPPATTERPTTSHTDTTTTGPGIATTAGEGRVSADSPLDPESDVQGWENGYWHDEAIPVESSDGLNLSEREALLDRSMARVERLRGMEFESDISVVLESRTNYRHSLEGQGSSDPTVRRFENARHEALFLAGNARDAGNLSTEEQASRVQGYFEPGMGRMVILTDDRSHGLDTTVNVSETLFAHELVHALQYRQGRLGGRSATWTSDGRLARRSIVEGEATHFTNAYVERCGHEWECVRDRTVDGNESDEHPGLAMLGSFPYVVGSDFIEATTRDGNWSAVAEMFERPPETTEQIAFPETYPDDDPQSITIPAVEDDAWERVRPDGRPHHEVLGVAGIAVMFAYPALDDRPGAVVEESAVRNQTTGVFEYRTDYARGWDGDKLAVYRAAGNRTDSNRTAGNRTAYVWRLAWDSSADAAAFAEGYRDLLRYWDAERVGDGEWRIPEGASPFADTFHVQVDGAVVTVVNHPTGHCLAVADVNHCDGD